MCICLDLVQDEWVVCIIFQKSVGGERSSIDLMRINTYNDPQGSPSFPSLLESPYNTIASNNQERRSSENKYGYEIESRATTYRISVPKALYQYDFVFKFCFEYPTLEFQFVCLSQALFKTTCLQFTTHQNLLKLHTCQLHRDLR